MKVLRHNSRDLESVKRNSSWNAFLKENEKQNEQTSGRMWEVEYGIDRSSRWLDSIPVRLIVQDYCKSGNVKLVYISQNGEKTQNWRTDDVYKYRLRFFEERGTIWRNGYWETEGE